MSTARRVHYSYEQYLAAQESSELRLEFFDGEIYAMAGGTPEHAALSARVITALSALLKDRCVVFTADLRIRVEASGLSTFPDASVVCGPNQTSSIDKNAVTNPTVLVEVTSASTEDYDRGEKLSHYKQLPSLQAVLIVSHSQRRVTVHSRDGKRWGEREFRSQESFAVPGLDVTLDVDELYGTLVR
jgi:Uma2 family endonuclease